MARDRAPDAPFRLPNGLFATHQDGKADMDGLQSLLQPALVAQCLANGVEATAKNCRDMGVLQRNIERAALANASTARSLTCTLFPKLPFCHLCAGDEEPGWCYCDVWIRVPRDLVVSSALRELQETVGDLQASSRLVEVTGCAGSCSCPIQNDPGLPCQHQLQHTLDRAIYDSDDQRVRDRSHIIAGLPVSRAQAWCVVGIQVVLPRLTMDSPFFRLEWVSRHKPLPMVGRQAATGNWKFYQEHLKLRGCDDTYHTGCEYYDVEFAHLMGMHAELPSHGCSAREELGFAFSHREGADGWLIMEASRTEKVLNQTAPLVAMNTASLSPAEKAVAGQAIIPQVTTFSLGPLSVNWMAYRGICRPVGRALLDKLSRPGLATEPVAVSSDKSLQKLMMGRMIQVANTEVLRLKEQGEISDYVSVTELVTAAVTIAHKAAIKTVADVHRGLQAPDCEYERDRKVVTTGQAERPNILQRLAGRRAQLHDADKGDSLIRRAARCVRDAITPTPPAPHRPCPHTSDYHNNIANLNRIFGPADAPAPADYPGAAPPPLGIGPPLEPPPPAAPVQGRGTAGRPDWRNGKAFVDSNRARQAKVVMQTNPNDDTQVVFRQNWDISPEPAKPLRKSKGIGKEPQVCTATGCQRVAPVKRRWPRGVCPQCSDSYGRHSITPGLTMWLQTLLDGGVVPLLPPGVYALGPAVWGPIMEANPKWKPFRDGARTTWSAPIPAPQEPLTTVVMAEQGFHGRKDMNANSAPPRCRSQAAALRGLMFPLAPSTPARTREQLQMAARYRLLAKPDGYKCSGAPKPGFWAAVKDLFMRRMDIARCALPGFGTEEFQVLTAAEWRKGFPGAKAREFEKQMATNEHNTCTADQAAKFKAFVKHEFALWGDCDYVKILSALNPDAPPNNVKRPEMERRLVRACIAVGGACANGRTCEACLTLLNRDWDRPIANPRLICCPDWKSHAICGPFLRPALHLCKKQANYQSHMFYASADPESMNEWANQFKGNYGSEITPQDDAAEDFYQRVPLVHSGKAYSKANRAHEAEEKPRKAPVPTYPGIPHFVMNDFSMMDNSCSRDTFLFNLSFLTVMGYPAAGRAADVWWAWCQPDVTVVLPDGTTHRMRPGYVNASGRDDTALINYIVNAVLSSLGWLCVFAAEKGLDCSLSGVEGLSSPQIAEFRRLVRIAIVGDDQLTAVPPAMAKQTAVVEDLAAQGGFKCKISSTDSFESTVFLGRRPVPVAVYRQGKWVAEYQWASQAGRMLYKSGWQKNPTPDGASWMKGEGFVEFLINGHVPILRAVFKATLAALEGVSMRLPDDFRIKPVPDVRLATRPTAETWDCMMHVYGITPALAYDLEEKLLRQVQVLPCYVSHPALDCIFAVDMGDC